ncbi:MAG: hypothetical protein NC548_47315 [Lachnospiraceae bacterium]|nr:hypothetical protein [Lachnospiraceae bacterium]
MKKYLQFLFVALFATVSFALTSCGDDNDEPDNGNGKSSFTVNGQAYKIPSLSTATLTNVTSQGRSQINFELQPIESDEFDIFPLVNVDIESDALPTPIAKGAKLSIKDNNSTYAEMITGIMETTRYTEYKSGSVTVESAFSTSVTLKFDNVKFADADGDILTLNGTINCDYDEF